MTCLETQHNEYWPAADFACGVMCVQPWTSKPLTNSSAWSACVKSHVLDFTIQR